MDNTNRRPVIDAATEATEKLIERLTDRGGRDRQRAWDLDELLSAVLMLDHAGLFADSTRKRAQVVDAFTDAQKACLAAIGRLVAQLDAELDAEDRESAADARDLAYITADAGAR